MNDRALQRLEQAARAVVSDLNHTIRDSERGATPVETRARLQLIADQTVDRINIAVNDARNALTQAANELRLSESKMMEQAQIINTIRATSPTAVAQAERMAGDERELRHCTSGICCPMVPPCDHDGPCYFAIPVKPR